jgi:hypothetical protein
MIGPNCTFARYNGLAVLIWTFGASYCVVRYIGAEGKQITTENFQAETAKLTAF